MVWSGGENGVSIYRFGWVDLVHWTTDELTLFVIIRFFSENRILCVTTSCKFTYCLLSFIVFFFQRFFIFIHNVGIANPFLVDESWKKIEREKKLEQQQYLLSHDAHVLMWCFDNFIARKLMNLLNRSFALVALQQQQQKKKIVSFVLL